MVSLYNTIQEARAVHWQLVYALSSMLTLGSSSESHTFLLFATKFRVVRIQFMMSLVGICLGDKLCGL